MSLTATTDQLRQDIDKCRADLARVEGQRERDAEELDKLTKEAEALKFDPDPEKLRTAAQRIREDVETALTGVKQDIMTLRGKAGGDAD